MDPQTAKEPASAQRHPFPGSGCAAGVGGTVAACPKNSLALNHAFHFLFWGH